MLIAEITEGLGHNMMSYVEFAEEAYPSEAERDLFDKLASELFKRGFEFTPSPRRTNGAFRKLEQSTLIRVIIDGPKGANTRVNRDLVMISRWTPPDNAPYKNFHVSDLVHSTTLLDQALRGTSDAAS